MVYVVICDGGRGRHTMGLKIPVRRPLSVPCVSSALYHILGPQSVGCMQMKEERVSGREGGREHNLKELCSLPDWWG